MRIMAFIQAADRRLFPDNPLLRLLAINGAIGALVAGGFLGGVFWANIGNLRELVASADSPLVPVVMLCVGFVITMSSVVMGTAIMMLKDQDQAGGGTLKRSVGRGHGQLIPVQLPVRGARASGDRERRKISC
ncbi:hypothetical protein [Roseibium sp.]|uniref:hypothetical protein n=1 Tax=Roseibium sp. TaxID=1936156 RepID=UPI003A972DF2